MIQAQNIPNYSSKSAELTLVCTTFNSKHYLEGFLENINNFTISDKIKLIIVMNEPDNEEISIINAFKNRLYEIEILDVQRETIPKSLNRGFALAQSKFVAYLDVDDRHPIDAYQRMIRTLEDADVTYGDYIIVNSANEVSGDYICLPEFDKNLGINHPMFGPTHCFRKTALESIGYWDEQMRSVGDFEWQIRAATKLLVKKTEGVISYYTNAPNSASKTKWHMIENLVLGLRYGQIDKIGPYIEGIDFISQYDIMHIKNFNTMISVNDVRKTERFELPDMFDALSEAIGMKRLIKMTFLSMFKKFLSVFKV